MNENLLPARMVNEFVYCPRLFYLEYVQGRFTDNDDTRIGQQVHHRVDIESGAAPLPAEGELKTARSVTLSSQKLGVIAKLDLIESVDSGGATPVDYKKGEPKADGTAWPSDEVQACIQGIVLRENGYRCDRVSLYYATTKQRISIDLTAERLAVLLTSSRRRERRRGRPRLRCRL